MKKLILLIFLIQSFICNAQFFIGNTGRQVKKVLAEKKIDFTEDLAKQINAKTIRFDTHTGNLPAAKLYLKKGYKLIGETPLNLDYDIEDSFKCFEKII